MTSTEKMPADPFTSIEEASLQRDIAAVDRRKAEEGTTWSQYLGSTIVLFGMTQEFELSLALRNRVNNMGTSLMPRLQKAERLNSRGFSDIKREVVTAVRDALTIQRELMDIPNPHKEE
jgi:hypothetical protein